MAFKNVFLRKMDAGCRAIFAAATMSLAGGCASTPYTPPPITYVDASDATALSTKLPRLYSQFQNMSRQPLTGRGIYDIVVDPAHGIRCASVPKSRLGHSTAGRYIPTEKTLVTKSDGASDEDRVIVHESFHAAQFVHSALPFALEEEDYARAILLGEATAIAYEFVYHKELDATNPGAYKRFSKSDENEDMRKFFEAAYNEKYKALAQADKKLREEKALEAGGQAVARALLAGKNEKWIRYYTFNAQFMSKRYAVTVPSAEKESGVYDRNRNQLYAGLGRVSDNINLTPPELLLTGLKADTQVILSAFK